MFIHICAGSSQTHITPYADPGFRDSRRAFRLAGCKAQVARPTLDGGTQNKIPETRPRNSKRLNMTLLTDGSNRALDEDVGFDSYGRMMKNRVR